MPGKLPERRNAGEDGSPVVKVAVGWHVLPKLKADVADAGKLRLDDLPLRAGELVWPVCEAGKGSVSAKQRSKRTDSQRAP